MGCKIAVHVVHPQQEEEPEPEPKIIKQNKILPRDESEEFYIPDGEYKNPMAT